MTNSIQITKNSLVSFGTTEIKLPFYYVAGNYFKHYVAITADRNLISFYRNGFSISIDTWKYDEDDNDSLARRIEKDMCDEFYDPILESVFMHMFSEAHRELFYQVNPNLKPIE